MSTRRHRVGVARQWILASVLLAGLACVEPTFQRVNPTDRGGDLEVRIVGGPDTVRAVGGTFAMRLESTPAVVGYPITWTSDRASLVASYSNGLFVVYAMPAVPTTVTITGRLGLYTAAKQVYIVP